MNKYIEDRILALEETVTRLERQIEIIKHKDSYTSDYIYNPSVNLMSHPELETSFAGSFDTFDTTPSDFDKLSDTPPYPEIIGSFDFNK